jgi:hypothetical protein
MEKVSALYKSLYHYTTWEGLLGILGSRSLWATHYRFLNDFSEIVLFRERLVTLMRPYVTKAYERLLQGSPNVQQKIDQDGGLRQAVQHDTEVLIDAQYRATGDEIYILSFCGEHKNPDIDRNGLLSQWRGYGAGGGFAIVFNTKRLEDILNLEVTKYHYSALILTDLVYSNNDDRLRSEMAEDLTNLADDVAKIFNHQEPFSENTELKGYYSFVNCVSRYKHYGFCEENEVRVVALPTVLDDEMIEMASKEGSELKPEKERKFRKKDGGLVPYIELFTSQDMELPIERIIVGPHKEKESRAAALRVMLQKTGIEISCSDIPFVG